MACERYLKLLCRDFAKVGMYLIIAFVFPFIVLVSPLSVKTHHDRLFVSWNPVPNPPQQWTITYNVMGTAYHSVLKVPGNGTSVNINTAAYPGVLYMIKLYASNNGTEYKGTTFGRSDCSKHIDTTIGSSYSFESFAYPGGLTSGAICTWTFTGSTNTWFKFELEDFDIGNSSCNSYLMVGNETICGNETVNGTALVYQPSFDIKLAYRGTSANRGVKFHVSAIHKLLLPSNVTATNIGNSIAVEWQQPTYNPENFTYVLRISHFPFNSHVDLILTGNTTRYVYHVTSHVGQNYSMQLQSVSGDLASAFTDALFVSTNCDRDIFIKATEKTTFLSEQYPHNYLPKLTCSFRFQTEADFYLLILAHDIDIGGGRMCDKTFFKIGNLGKFCADAQAPSRLVIQMPSVNMLLRTSDEADGRGINITIVSVAKPPMVPNNVAATSDETSIYATWKPPSLQQVYIKGYSVQYFIAPNTPGATLSVDKDVHNITINTQSHPGRLYAMRIAAFTDGGVGNFSHPFYVRAGCGHRIRLLRHESAVIMSPSNNNGHYEPETVCQWGVKTAAPLWMKVTINKIVIEESDNCSKDYVEVTGVGRLCGLHGQSSTVIKVLDVAVTFRSNYQNESKGFSIVVEAVGPAPGQPRGVRVSQTGYAVVIKWMPPTLHRRFLTGYLINFNFYGDTTSAKNRVGPDTNYHVLDMTSYPGRLIEIWLQADGDVEKSNASERLFIRTECGHAVDVSGPTYISSPYYENNYYANIQCLWTLEIPKQVHVEMRFIRLNLNNNMETCENYILVNNESRYCDDLYDNRSVVFTATTSLTLEWHTGPSGKGTYFLLSVEPAADTRSESVTSRPASSCSDMIHSSTPLLMTSYFGTLLASTLMVSTALSSYGPYVKNATEESPHGTKIPQTMPPRHGFTDLQKDEMLQTTVISETIQTRTKEGFVARQTVLMLNTEATVDSNRASGSSSPDSKSSYKISPTRASSFFSASCDTEDEQSVVLTSSLKHFTTDITTIAASDQTRTSLSKTAASVSITMLNTKAMSINVSKSLNFKHTATSPQLPVIDSSKVIFNKGDQEFNTLLPSGSSSFSGSSSSISLKISKGANNIILTSRDIETENIATPTKETGQEEQDGGNGAEQLHYLLYSIFISLMIIPVMR